jgi:adenylate cyclase
VGEGADAEAWLGNFERHARGARLTRRLLRRLPHEPRCKFCYAPFQGAGGRLVRVAGRRPSRKNPNLCDVCIEKGPSGGFETDGGVLFADVRGFTAFSETRSPSEVAETMDRFYSVTTSTLVAHEAVIDKLVGDEVMALFWPLLMDEDPCAAMVGAGAELLRAVGYGTGEGAWLPLGVGIDFGRMHIGNVGPTGMQDFTALGDVVNTAARLQGEASGGQIVMSDRVYDAVRNGQDARPIQLELKGKAGPVNAYVVEIGRDG